MPHIIRLRGPWEHEPLPLESAIRFTRRFHRPTGLDATSRVWLVIEHCNSTTRIKLNDRDLTQNTTRYDITADLQLMNVLSITVVASKEPQPTEIDFVRLEIE